MARKKDTSKDDQTPEVEGDPWAEVKEIYFKVAIDRGHGSRAKEAAERWTENLISEICYKEKIGDHNVAKLVKRAIKKAKSGHVPTKLKQDTYWLKKASLEEQSRIKEVEEQGAEIPDRFWIARSYLRELHAAGENIDGIVQQIYYRIRKGAASNREIEIASALRAFAQWLNKNKGGPK